LQLDFGEVDQGKSVNLVEVHARQPSRVTPLPITAGRRLVDVGSPLHGVALNDLAPHAESAGDAWLRVYVELDLPVANLPAMVREQLPNAVHVERARPSTSSVDEEKTPARVLTQEELFSAFYRSDLGRRQEPSPATLTLFRRLLEEEADATADA
jgi:exonuclease SbcD